MDISKWQFSDVRVSWGSDYSNYSNIKLRLVNDYRDLYPERIIFNNRTTICYWNDGKKTVVHCKPDDEFSEEMGVLQCIARRMFNGNRSAFLKYVDEHSYRQPPKEK